MEKVTLRSHTTLLFWLASGMGLIGTFLNALHLKEGFYFWAVSNPILCYQAVQTRSWNIALMFFTYLLLAIFGLIYWSIGG